MIDPGSWRVAPAAYDDVRALASELEVSEVLAQILVRRGFRDPASARAFLQPDFRVHAPHLLQGIRAARKRIDRALQLGEPIAVHGDYDVDGITATFLLVGVLEELGAEVRWYLPNRFTDGYGVSMGAVEQLAGEGVKLLITVDCGINARAEVARAGELGMDVVVTDHHELEGDPPECVVVTPKLGSYPSPQLAGVGVAFKLGHALLEEPGADLVPVPLALRAYTDLVAVGTIADVVPLVGENRVLAAIGLGRLRSAPRPGLAALLEVAGSRPGSVDAGVVGFRIAPRLNAAGRLEDASVALQLLGAPDRETAMPLALKLNELNRDRQAIEAAMLAQAVELVPDPLPPALVLSSADWHEGVVGIVASRVAERFFRPAILLSEGGEEAKGSGRSIASFDLLGALEASAERLLSFGGHRAACGVRLRTRDIPAFREDFVAAAAARLDAADLRRVRDVDAVVGGDDLTLGLADELEQLAPHGFGNRQVTLLLHGAEVVAPRLTRDGRHAQYRVRCDDASCQAIHFGFDDLGELKAPGRHDIALSLSKNEYNGAVSAQVQVRGLHRLPRPDGDLCATACVAACRDRVTGQDLWALLVPGATPASISRPGIGARQDAPAGGRGPGQPRGPAAERLLDRRGRSVASALAALAATGERLLVLVADVARRRPFLTADVLSPDLGLRAGYVQAACAARATALAAGADVVMAGIDLAASLPGFAGGFAHVALADPPCTTAQWAAVAAAAPQAWVHALWGPAEARDTEAFRQASLGLDTVMRTVWKALSSGSGRFDDALEQELLGHGGLLPPLPVLAAAFATLRESGLLVVAADGSYHLERPQSKVDVTRTDAYREWHSKYQTPDFLPTCLTGRL